MSLDEDDARWSQEFQFIKDWLSLTVLCPGLRTALYTSLALLHFAAPLAAAGHELA